MASSVIEVKSGSSSKMAVPSRLGQCTVCVAAPSRYKCPACLVTTCSLECVKQHKEEAKCSGIRHKTKLVQVTEFTDLNLLSDYRFLEEIGRSVDNLQRQPLVRGKPQKRPPPLPYWLNKMVTMCRKRGTNLKLGPRDMKRRIKNSSQFSQPLNEMLWHIEWTFPQAEMTYTDTRISENLTLSQALEKYMNPKCSTDAINQQLSFYQSAGYENIVVVMKQMDGSYNNRRYFQLDLNKSLCENLRNKTVVEYPLLDVVLKNHIQMYDIISSDSDESDCDGLEELEIRHSRPTADDNEMEPGECPISSESDDE